MNVLYNLDSLNEIAEGDRDFMKEIIELFITGIPDSVAKMNKAYRDKDYTVLSGEAHKIKPSIDTMGIVLIHDEIRTIEREAAKGELANVQPALEKVTTVLQQVVDQLKGELQKR